MLVPVKWLKEYIDIDADVREIADKASDSGSHVESIETKNKEVSGLVVAQIMDIYDDQRLKNTCIVKLDLGDEKIDIVTGAKNMKLGDKVILAKIGAKLPGGIEIGQADFNGVKSLGMLCSYEELGFEDAIIPKNSKDGIAILGNDVKVGSCGIKALDLDQKAIEFEITPNRPDCLSIIGMAREVAATFQEKIKLPKSNIDNGQGDINDIFSGLEVQTENATRFILRAIKDIKIEDSPQELQNKLMAAGMRPINNIVDLTNYIMLEYGQPLHAYDLDKIKENKLIVRMAKNGEKVLTLDKNERELTSDDIVICDGKSTPIGLAGIMGGYDTEVTETTKNILIEAASFNSSNIRKTSKRLNLRSEASTRFEKAVSPKLSEIAIERFCHLIEEIGAGTVINGSLEAGYIKEERKLKLRNSRLNILLGLDLKVEQTAKYLEALEIETKIEGENIECIIPYFRDDISVEADLVEEVGRLYGYHNIKPRPLQGSLTKGIKSEKRLFIDNLRKDLYSLAFDQILTFSFISPKQYDNLNVAEDGLLRNYISLINPLGEDFSVMRTTLLGNILDVVRKNLNNKLSDLRLSEISNCFFKDKDGTNYENHLMTFALVGDYDFYYTKDIVENIFANRGIENFYFIKNEENDTFHNGRCADIFVEGEKVGIIGEIHPLVLDNFDIGKRVYAVEVNVDKLQKYGVNQIIYKPVSKFPLVERDIALVVDYNVESEKIIEIIKSNGGENLKSVDLFDIYTGSQIEKGKKSYAYKIGFQSFDRTLKDKEVKDAFDRILEALNKEFDVDLRG